MWGGTRKTGPRHDSARAEGEDYGGLGGLVPGRGLYCVVPAGTVSMRVSVFRVTNGSEVEVFASRPEGLLNLVSLT